MTIADKFTPAVIITIITAIVGPITLFHFEDINQKRNLQQQLLSKVLDHATTTNNDDTYLDKIAIVIALVQDNKEKFDLSFPSADKIVAQRRKLAFQKLQSKLAKQTAETEISRTELTDKIEELDIKTLEVKIKNKKIKIISNRIKILNKNKGKHKVELKKLTTEKNQLKDIVHQKQKDIDILSKSKKVFEEKVDAANSALLKSQQDINFLNYRDKKQTDRITTLTAVVETSNKEILKLKDTEIQLELQLKKLHTDFLKSQELVKLLSDKEVVDKNEILDLNTKLNNSVKTISQLNGKIQALNAEYNNQAVSQSN